ncbi:hypothetical protein HanPSC8_Chr16g0725861 [Helianthus annuus]|nr:hypothetical protein HanPSC8_Chr16g0725861 [Helianthus annuus]
MRQVIVIAPATALSSRKINSLKTLSTCKSIFKSTVAILVGHMLQRSVSQYDENLISNLKQYKTQ